MERFGKRGAAWLAASAMGLSLLGSTALAAPPPPASWPADSDWILLNTDPLNNGTADDYRDVVNSYWAVDCFGSQCYLFLRLENAGDAGWSSTSTDPARYKWTIDVDGDGQVQGGNIEGAEYMLMVEDFADNTTTNAASGGRDRFGELTFLDDGPFARWQDGSPDYLDNGEGSSDWRRVWADPTDAANSTDLGGPQEALGDEVGYRLTGVYVDMYVELDLIGDPGEVNLLWATDQQNPNLDQAPNTDRPTEGFADINTNGTVRIIKDAVPNDPQDFSFSSSDWGAFTLDDDDDGTLSNTFTQTGVEPGSYTVTEGADPAGWNLSSIVCDDPDGGSTTDVGTRTATIDVDPLETVTCTFVNTQTPTEGGTIVITKNAVPDDPQDFAFTGDLNFTLDDDGGTDATHSNVFTAEGVDPASYTVTETVPSGWDLTDLACTDPSGGTTVDVGTATATIDLAEGETVSCTFENTKQGSITIEKTTDPADSGSFSFEGDEGVGDFNLAGGESETFDDLEPGTYDVLEVVPVGWNLTGIVCDDSDGGTSVSLATATASIDLDPGQDITCTFNNARLGSLTIVKDTQPDDPQDFLFTWDSGSFTLDDDGDNGNTYSNTTTLSGLVEGEYTVTETEPEGWVVDEITCEGDTDGGSSVDVASGTLTADVDHGEDLVCTFVNKRVQPIPTLSQWASILMALMLAGLGGLTLRRRIV